MELFKYYNLDECIDFESIEMELEELEYEGKIEFTIKGDILKIIDIELLDNEIIKLEKLFDKNDIFPDPDYDDYEEDDYTDDDYFDNFGDWD